MDGDTVGLLSGGAKRSRRVRPLVALSALLILLPTAVLGDDMIMGNLGGALAFIGMAVLVAAAGVAAFSVVVCLLEAYLMDRFVKLGYLRCLWYSLVANVVSMGLGGVWYLVGGQTGWKTALIHGQYGMVWWLLLRSFVITVAEEAVVVTLLVRRRRDFETVIRAVLAANAGSYAILGVIAALIGAFVHP